MLVRPANQNATSQITAEELARDSVRASLDAHQRLLEQGVSVIARIGNTLAAALLSGHKVLFCGNGGSAADAQHAAAELVGRFYRDRAPLAAISLTTDTSILTAVGNDWAFEEVFARQVQALGAPGDVVVGMTTSGRSKNIVRAFTVAREKGLCTIALTGQDGRDVERVSDICFRAPDSTTPRIQELHILALHSICEIVEATVIAHPV